MNDATQRAVARRMTLEFEEHHCPVVLIGSTAVMRTLAKSHALEYHELGWSALALVRRGEDGHTQWRIDLLVPEQGMIPPAAARLIHAHAQQTEIGRAAVPEHLVVMKAVAMGDCIGKGEMGRAEDYESDLIELRRSLPSIDESLIKNLLLAYPEARRGPAIRAINDTFGTGFTEPGDPSL